MLDLEAARLVVERREQERIDALVNEEAAAQQHRAMLIANAQSMSASMERNRQERSARHGEARDAARTALDSLKALTSARAAIESRLGFSKADLEAAQKNASRCAPPPPESYPTPAELDAHRQRRAGLDAEVMHIQGRISAESAELDRAKFAEWEAEAAFERAKRAEWERRSEL